MARPELSIGEAVIGLLEAYGVDTVFGIPGVHNVEWYRALPRSRIRHILPRHEQGAGFMADGYARATGKPGVCFTITGPGLGNIMTPVGQAYSDSVPLLVISSCLDVGDAAHGRGRLHEMRDQRGAAAAVCASAVTAYTERDAQDAIAAAFASFASERPRPHYVELPIDVMNRPAAGPWTARALPSRPVPDADRIAEAVELLNTANSPVLLLGGGACEAGSAARRIAEALDAIVFTTNAGKGIVPESHPLNVGAVLPAPQASRILQQADVVLAAGTEIAETDLWYQRFDITGKLIRIDIDPASLVRPYRATVPIRADAGTALEAIAAGLDSKRRTGDAAGRVQALAAELEAGDDDLRKLLRKVLGVIRTSLPADTLIATDMTQIAYAGNEIFPVEQPGCWFHPVGFGTLGYALPAAIGARAAYPERPVAALFGDYGFQYTVNELGTAAELGGPLVMLLWNNDGLAQIRDGMVMTGIQPNAVTLRNPDFQALAGAYGCAAQRPASLKELAGAIGKALAADRPTLIEMTPAMAAP